MEDLLIKRWNSVYVTGDIEPPKPGLLAFREIEKAIEILHKHVIKNNRIVLHSDVDLDGISCGYVSKRALHSLGARNTVSVINKEKLHGIQEKHADYFNNTYPIDLIIIMDSSSNELDNIRKFHADVIVVDHHEIGHENTYGKTEDGHDYVIVNNMLDNLNGSYINEWLREKNSNTKEIMEDYHAEERMSGCMVLYELLRVYCEAYRLGPLLENLMLFQWVGCSLYSDSIQLTPDRNQWYINKTVHNMDTESSLKILIDNLNSYKARLDKSFILYTLAPAINKAIRAGFSAKALDIITNKPELITELMEYNKPQEYAVSKCCSDAMVYSKDYIIKDITSYDISKNYCGVIASRLCGDNNKNTVVYILNGEMAEGSFRGRRMDVDYREFFNQYSEDVFAEGHKAAFGFKVHKDVIEDIMDKLSLIEPEKEKFYLTAGRVPEKYRGVYHIDDMEQFKKQFYVVRLALANSNLSSLEQLDIIGSSLDVVLEEQVGKIYKYDFMGLKCKAFEPIKTELVAIYLEYSNVIEIYIKNYNI